MNTQSVGQWRLTALLAVVTALCVASAFKANAADITWVGNTDAWFDPGNWSPEIVPGLDDVAWIPAQPILPAVDAGQAYCRGLILAEDASVSVRNGGALYVVNPEDTLELPDPEEDPEPAPVSALRFSGMITLAVALALVAMIVLLRRRPWPPRTICLLLIPGFLTLFGYWSVHDGRIANAMTSRPQKSEATHVDFDSDSADPHAYYTIPDALQQTPAGGLILVDGGSLRPWNGRTTYVHKSATLEAANGPVFLGGVRTSFQLTLHGEGEATAASAYTQPDHPDALNRTVSAGAEHIPCFLGERLALEAIPGHSWGFVEWTDDAAGSTPVIPFQAASHGLAATALFSSPGADLAIAWDAAPPTAPVMKDDVVTVTLRVRNIGQQETDAIHWTDGLFLSRDTVYDAAADLELIAPMSRSGTLDSFDFYDVSFSVVIPDVAPGTYYILGVADENGDVSETNKNNNTATAEVTVLDANLAQ